MYLCVSGIDFASFYNFVYSDIGGVPTLCYFFSFDHIREFDLLICIVYM